MMAEECLLVGDIGGTNARFALANHTHPGLREVRELKCADFATTADAIRHYLSVVDAATPEAICLAAAGPIVDDIIDVTNNHWRVAAESLSQEFDVDALRLLNDFEAIAYSIPFMSAEDRHVVGTPLGFSLANRSFNVAILGPGTGLGVAGLIGRGGSLVPVTGEGGHVGFAPENPLQSEILEVLRRKYERVSAERLVAGSGIVNLHEALAEIRGEQSGLNDAAGIFAAARDHGSELARETTRVFFEILGQVAGDLALTLGAGDGVYIAGGIAKRYPDMLVEGHFREAFERKGRHRHIMERIPTFLITHEQPGLLGAAYCVLELSSAAASS
jgi:glucokinase